MKEKIFGIGLGKTGLTSLKQAMAALGHSVLQQPMRIDRRMLAPYSFICDKPINYRFREVAELYPEARYILTLRPIEAWLKCQARVSGVRREGHDLKMRRECYGCDLYDEDTFRDVYMRHYKDVLAFFRTTPERLLVLNIFEGQGWKELVDFLKPEFPWCNRWRG